MNRILSIIFCCILATSVYAETIVVKNLTYDNLVKNLLCEIRLYSNDVQVYYSKKQTNKKGKIYINSRYFKGVDKVYLKTTYKNVYYDLFLDANNSKKYVFDVFDVKNDIEGIDIEFDNISVSDFEGKKIIERSLIIKNSTNYVYYNNDSGLYLPLSEKATVLSVYPKGTDYNNGVLIKNGIPPGESKINVTYMLTSYSFTIGDFLPVKSFLMVLDKGLDVSTEKSLTRNVKKISSGENIVYVYSENISEPKKIEIKKAINPIENWLDELLISFIVFVCLMVYLWIKKRPMNSHFKIIQNLEQRERYGKELDL